MRMLKISLIIIADRYDICNNRLDNKTTPENRINHVVVESSFREYNNFVRVFLAQVAKKDLAENRWIFYSVFRFS